VQKECPLLREVRVLGVMIGLELAVEGAAVVKKCLERKLLVNCTQNVVIRLLPAMNLSLEQAEEGSEILAGVLRELTV
jgi:acetylornithine/N-succinyldiaminopimelate aminotransferase